MIYFLVGDNDFELQRELVRRVAEFDGSVIKPDVNTLQPGDLVDLLTGQTLFDEKRLVILQRPAENKPLWDALPVWLERVADDQMVVIVEPKSDKRGATYKALQKRAETTEFAAWTNRDQPKAISWAISEAKQRHVALSPALARRLVERTGADQWRIFRALEKLALAGDITEQTIDDIVEAHPEENVFQLLETALAGRETALRSMLETLRLTADPYQTFGLLTSQLLALRLLSLSTAPASSVAKDAKMAPFMLTKLAPFAKKLGPKKTSQLIRFAATTDQQMKSSGQDPWMLITVLLQKIVRDV